ncbi:MAG: hypothetical protein JWM11_7936 [Planctomycetaceae bacterium]|nr:hypothetical protein [Planctomycetaceae bacterium]
MGAGITNTMGPSKRKGAEGTFTYGYARFADRCARDGRPLDDGTAAPILPAKAFQATFPRLKTVYSDGKYGKHNWGNWL